MQSRFRSKAAWVAVISLVLFILKTYYKFELPEADTLIDLILITASTLGIFNNPTDKENY